jgi:hypothetical protein
LVVGLFADLSGNHIKDRLNGLAEEPSRTSRVALLLCWILNGDLPESRILS